MARPLTEEGDGAPSLRPLYMLLPYLWPKGYRVSKRVWSYR